MQDDTTTQNPMPQDDDQKEGGETPVAPTGEQAPMGEPMNNAGDAPVAEPAAESSEEPKEPAEEDANQTPAGDSGSTM